MSTIIVLKRGKDNLPPLQLQMERIYHAENRLKEVAFVTPVTSLELCSFFNEVCNETTKYESWVEYEILEAQKNLDKVKSGIIIDKLPELAKELKETGQKANEAWRDAIIMRDPDYEKALDKVNALKAVKSLLHNKAESFKRAYFSAKDIAKNKDQIGATPNISRAVGDLSDPQHSFMGTTQLNKR